jgi:hypothetical protein
LQVGWVADVRVTTRGFAAESLTDFAGRKRNVAFQRTVVAVLNIVGIVIPWPPAHHA